MCALPRVGIIVLNYNGKNCLLSCLQSLDRLECSNKEIVVVDNNSTDGSLEEAEKKFPHFIFVRNQKNEGFARGMNIGIKEALARGAKWCWIFNYDAVAHPQALNKLISAAQENPKAGLLSPVVYEANRDNLWFAKGIIDFLRMRTLHIQPTKQELAAKTYKSEFLTGCALLIKKELIEKIGFLDERFFLYYEDADYSLRSTQAGADCLVAPEAKVSHSEESKLNPSKIYYLVYSGLIFFNKWTPFYLRSYFVVYVTMRRTKNFWDRLFGKSEAAQEVYRAYRDYLSKL
jgi:GT2 family glycosyltransferase